MPLLANLSVYRDTMFQPKNIRPREDNKLLSIVQMLHCLTYKSCVRWVVIPFVFCSYSFLLYKEPITSENIFKNYYKENTRTVFSSEKCPQLNTFCNVRLSDLHTNKQHIHYTHKVCVCACVCVRARACTNVCIHKIQSVFTTLHPAPAALKSVHPSPISCKQQITFSCPPIILQQHYRYVNHFNA